MAGNPRWCLSICIFCIPATSAPAERFFSVTGLTIAKDHARMAAQTTNELIFLHEVVPAVLRNRESFADEAEGRR
jgi:hypothetical protein